MKSSTIPKVLLRYQPKGKRPLGHHLWEMIRGSRCGILTGLIQVRRMINWKAINPIVRSLFKKYRRIFKFYGLHSIHNFFFCYFGTYIHNICCHCQPFWIFSLFLRDTKVRRVLVYLAIRYRKNESVLSVRRVMRHLVIHLDSCSCLSPGVKSW